MPLCNLWETSAPPKLLCVLRILWEYAVLLGWCSGDHCTPYLSILFLRLLFSCCGGRRPPLLKQLYLYFLNLHHIITPADVSPNGNAIHTPISP